MKKFTSLWLSIMITSITLLFPQFKKKDILRPAISKEELGKMIFFNESLSNPAGQSCGSCHAVNTAFTDPAHSIVSPGIVDGLFGQRNAQTISYSMFAPALHFDSLNSTYAGGLFWDGRVNSLEEQATKPFFAPLEMNNTDINMFMSKVENAAFYPSLIDIYGNSNDPQMVLNNVVDALAAFERSPEVNPFTSKFDYYLKGEVKLSSAEYAGMLLFKDTAKAKCGNCHAMDPDPASGKILFTDFTYDNIGVPRNLFNPFYTIQPIYNPSGETFIDYGLANTTHSAANNGQFKVPTLRNIALTAPYFHNGVFGTLEEVVHFYNKRDEDHTIASPEVPENVNHDELGDLKLTDEEEKEIVAYLKTLSDGYIVH